MDQHTEELNDDTKNKILKTALNKMSIDIAYRNMFIEYLNAKAEREGATYPDLKVEDILLVDKFILDDIDLFTEETKVERPTNFFERKVTSHENECEKNDDFDIDF